MNFLACAACLVVIAGACRAAPEPPVPDSTRSDTAVVSAPAVDSSRLIRADGIAHARAGMTIGALRAALPAGMSLGAAAPFMVDIVALPIMQGTDSLYYVLAAGGEPTDDNAIISLVAPDDTAFRTAAGVGPGTTIVEAARRYGPATISYNTNDESREYVTFARNPDPTIVFRATPSLEGDLAGIYATEGEHNTTTAYEPHAMVGLVMVRLRP